MGDGRGGRSLPAVTARPLSPPQLGSGPPSPLNPLVGPAFLLGRGGHGILQDDGHCAD